MTTIATLTLNPAVDKCSAVQQVVPEHKLRCQEPMHHPGGGGLNVARAIHELGGEAAAFWMCGGLVGERLGNLLTDEGITHHPIPIQGCTRENLVVYEESSGQQFRFGMPGAKLQEDEIEACREALQSLDPPPAYLVLSGSLPPSVDHHLYARLAEKASLSTRIVLDASGNALKAGLESRVFLIKPNIRELGELVDGTIEDDSQIRAAAQSLIADGKVEFVVTSLGSGGAVLTTADEQFQFRAPTVKIRSKVGAGDCTVAGLVLALAEGKSISEAVRFGVAAGSAAVMTKGTELCRREDVERLFNER